MIAGLIIQRNQKIGIDRMVDHNIHFLSPEILQDKVHSKKSDIWQLGCILYEMCQLKKPFIHKDFKILSNHICNSKYEKLPKSYS